MARPVFLAAPERGHGARSMVEALLRELQVLSGGALKGSHVFVPHLQVGEPGIDADAATFFSRSLEALQEAQVVVAVLDGAQADESVAFWMGYAFAAGKPIVGHVTDGRAKAEMTSGACVAITTDARGLADALARALAG